MNMTNGRMVLANLDTTPKTKFTSFAKENPSSQQKINFVEKTHLVVSVISWESWNELNARVSIA
jgi:hypothetical protein